MPRLSPLIPAAVVGVLAWASPALAPSSNAAITPGCHSHSGLAEMLDRKFAEQPTALGLQSDGQLVEVFVTKDGASWTIVVTRPDGWSCIVAVGEDWESLSDVVTGPLA